ncbi:hypothetical protein [Filimonas lacunae]|nr:hypothetical protein [Filimonas lacunae]BAV09703.1 hypothetical protein FLA_5756 [Filimonas lacunae]
MEEYENRLSLLTPAIFSCIYYNNTSVKETSCSQRMGYPLQERG